MIEWKSYLARVWRVRCTRTFYMQTHGLQEDRWYVSKTSALEAFTLAGPGLQPNNCWDTATADVIAPCEYKRDESKTYSRQLKYRRRSSMGLVRLRTVGSMLKGGRRQFTTVN